jgi:signal transduction histidine kinase
VPRELPKARAIAGAVREILDVLIDNAVEHGEGTVRLTARALSHSVAVEISDQGPGVAAGEIAFERRTGHGHGIGLALARSLAEADGGRLDLVDRRPGRTRFTLLLRAEG